jgi:hypothetical protein
MNAPNSFLSVLSLIFCLFLCRRVSVFVFFDGSQSFWCPNIYYIHWICSCRGINGVQRFFGHPHLGRVPWRCAASCAIVLSLVVPQILLDCTGGTLHQRSSFLHCGRRHFRQLSRHLPHLSCAVGIIYLFPCNSHRLLWFADEMASSEGRITQGCCEGTNSFSHYPLHFCRCII